MYFRKLLNAQCRYFQCYRCYSNQLKKVLIANRGEIACRVIKTAKRLGLQTVAVYSDADVHSMHVSAADEAHNIGPPSPAESYLRSDKLIQVAKKSGCQAVHPGYGFLSENADFADCCNSNNIVFIGPPAAAIRNMGCKSTAKKLMEAAGVPVVKGYHSDDLSDARLKTEAEKIGYPVILKALKGGGGKGMRIVLSPEKFDEELASARNEALKSFGDAAMLVESFISHPRHVEVQVFGDAHGNYLHMHERDCSVQRRHQKVIEEAPAPGLPEEVRRALGETAVRAARAVGYVGAGTVEFILDASTFQYYFMEMNTRLQVEHPVTEMITNLDLVELQFKVATGEALPISQKEIMTKGHAFETRIYAEDPDNNFLPQAGTLNYLKMPQGSPQVRVDTGVRGGDKIPVFYDPLIAKLIVWGADRAEALGRLQRSLLNFHVSGVPTNVNFLLALSQHSEFANGNVHTNFISEHQDSLLRRTNLDQRLIAAAITAQLHAEMRGANSNDPFTLHSGLRVNLKSVRSFKFLWQGEEVNVKLTNQSNGSKVISYSRNGHTEEFTVVSSKCIEENAGGLLVDTNVDGSIERSTAVVTDHSIQVFNKDGVSSLEIPQEKFVTDSDGEGSVGQLAASPMPGVVDQLLVAVSDVVTQGQALVTVIAMKMEYTIRAPHDGIVSELLCKSGDSVAKGAILVRFKE